MELRAAGPVLLLADRVTPDHVVHGLTRSLLSGRALGGVPVLVAMAAREAAHLPAAADPLPLSPLEPAQVTILLAETLGLAPDLVEAVVTYTRGNPGWVTRTMTRWVTENLLEPGPRGLRARGSTPLPFAPDLDSAGTAQIDAALARLGEEERRSLEVLAVGGRTVTSLAWRRACASAGVELSIHALGVLTRSGGLLADGDWLRWHDETVREGLAFRLQPQDRARLHLAWAEALHGEAAVQGARARGEHLLAAGRPMEAADALLAASETPGPPFRRHALASLTATALEEAGVPRKDPRWGRVVLLQVRWRRDRTYAGHLAAAKQALTEARARGWPEEIQMGLLESAAQAALACGAWASAHRWLGDAERLAGQPDAMRMRFQAQASEGLGDPAQARERYRGALRVATAKGERFEVGAAWNDLADLALKEGDEATAEVGFARAEAAMAGNASPMRLVPRLNRLHLTMRRGQVAEALPELLGLVRQARDEGAIRIAAGGLCLLVPAAAHAGEEGVLLAALDALEGLEDDLVVASELVAEAVEQALTRSSDPALSARIAAVCRRIRGGRTRGAS